jgi:hypothetical protein
MLRWVVVCLLLSGCGLDTLKLLSGGGGPTVNSNAQIGKENKQAAVTFEEETTAGRDVITTEVSKQLETGSVDSIKILNSNVPFWVILLLILGWLLPTPTEMGRGIISGISSLFRKRKNVYNSNSADASRDAQDSIEPDPIPKHGNV